MSDSATWTSNFNTSTKLQNKEQKALGTQVMRYELCHEVGKV